MTIGLFEISSRQFFKILFKNIEIETTDGNTTKINPDQYRPKEITNNYLDFLDTLSQDHTVSKVIFNYNDHVHDATFEYFEDDPREFILVKHTITQTNGEQLPYFEGIDVFFSRLAYILFETEDMFAKVYMGGVVSQGKVRYGFIVETGEDGVFDFNHIHQVYQNIRFLQDYDILPMPMEMTINNFVVLN